MQSRDVTTPNSADDRTETPRRGPGFQSWKPVLFPALVVLLASAMVKVADEPVVPTPPANVTPTKPVVDSVAPVSRPPAAAVAARPTVSDDRVFPVASRELSNIVSRFGDARDGGRRTHLGIDIAAPRGTAVVAVSDGRVERVENTKFGGRVVWLTEDGSARRHYFAHLESIKVARGQRVRAGQTIGTVGTSGNASSTAPHLHYAVRVGKDHLDPTSLFRNRGEATDSTGAARVMRTRLAGAALKAKPGGPTIAVLSANQPVTIQSESGRFYRVRYRGKTGYIARWLLTS